MRDHAAAIHAPPHKGIHREFVEIVPADFGGAKIFHTAFAQNLRQGRIVPKGIRQPETIAGVAKMFACEPLSIQKLPRDGFAGRNVAIALHPHAAVGLVAPFEHALANPFENCRIILAHPIQMQRGRLEKTVFGIAFHQSQRLRIRARALTDRLVHGPQPGAVHMRMPKNPHETARTVFPFARS